MTIVDKEDSTNDEQVKSYTEALMKAVDPEEFRAECSVTWDADLAKPHYHLDSMIEEAAAAIHADLTKYLTVQEILDFTASYDPAVYNPYKSMVFKNLCLEGDKLTQLFKSVNID